VKVWNSAAEIPTDHGPSAVTIGKFDGIHLGHQKLLKTLVDSAQEKSLQKVVVSFNAHPLTVINPVAAPKPIIGASQKQTLLEQAAVDALLELEFDEQMAALSPREFVSTYLVELLNAKVVAVGEGFRFGVGATGTTQTLTELGAEYGFTTVVIPAVVVDGQVVSSSLIRAKLEAGDVKTASRLLGRPHANRGVIEHGLKIGRTIGFPTANMTRNCEGYMPMDGVYAGWLKTETATYPAALSVGINETFQAVPRLVEAHVLDRTDLDLYDQVVDLEYVDFIRLSAKFDGIESLVEEIHRDLAKVRVILGLKG
jgi:riboflavin kinase/FMN adenylyltransferase